MQWRRSRATSITLGPLARKSTALLMVVFCRNLRRHAAKLGRVELAGGANEFGIHASSWSWIDSHECTIGSRKNRPAPESTKHHGF